MPFAALDPLQICIYPRGPNIPVSISLDIAIGTPLCPVSFLHSPVTTPTIPSNLAKMAAIMHSTHFVAAQRRATTGASVGESLTGWFGLCCIVRGELTSQVAGGQGVAFEVVKKLKVRRTLRFMRVRKASKQTGDDEQKVKGKLSPMVDSSMVPTQRYGQPSDMISSRFAFVYCRQRLVRFGETVQNAGAWVTLLQRSENLKEPIEVRPFRRALCAMQTRTAHCIRHIFCATRSHSYLRSQPPLPERTSTPPAPKSISRVLRLTGVYT
eukprot:1187897-Prorocentrum_minimum.AAC.1